MNFTSL